MEIFVDSANLADIECVLERGLVNGITTNPSLLAKEPKTSFEEHVGKIIELIKRYKPGLHLSVEVFSRDPDEILKQAQHFVEKFAYPELSIKVQIGWDELKTISKLNQAGISVNCTACMSVSQALLAAQAGAEYVSIFWGRIRDGGNDPACSNIRYELKRKNVVNDHSFDPAWVVQSTRRIFDHNAVQSKIIIGSIRSILDIQDAILAGTHIVTVPPKFFKDMATHFKTTEVVDQFMADFQNWLQ